MNEDFVFHFAFGPGTDSDHYPCTMTRIKGVRPYMATNVLGFARNRWVYLTCGFPRGLF